MNYILGHDISVEHFLNTSRKESNHAGNNRSIIHREKIGEANRIKNTNSEDSSQAVLTTVTRKDDKQYELSAELNDQQTDNIKYFATVTHIPTEPIQREVIYGDSVSSNESFQIYKNATGVILFPRTRDSWDRRTARCTWHGNRKKEH